jgi:RNA polymerase sigma-70 factor (family 1)
MNKGKEQDFEYAFHQLYLQYSGKVYSFIMRNSGGNKFLAEEVVQTVFMKVWERRAQFDDCTVLHPYLFAVVRNTFYKMCAHEAVKYAYEHQLKCTSEDVDSADLNGLLDEERLHDAILKLVEQMPERRRKVFYKSRIENKPYNTIAEEMNISEKTVGAHMTMALRFLREHLRDYTNLLLLLFLLINLYTIC